MRNVSVLQVGREVGVPGDAGDLQTEPGQPGAKTRARRWRPIENGKVRPLGHQHDAVEPKVSSFVRELLDGQGMLSPGTGVTHGVKDEFTSHFYSGWFSAGRTKLQRQYRPDGKNGQEGDTLRRHPLGPHVDEFEAFAKSGRLPNESFHKSQAILWDRRSRNRPGGFFGDLNGGLQWEVQCAGFGRNGLIPRAVVSINTDCESTRDTTSVGTVFQQLTGSPSCTASNIYYCRHARPS